MKTNLRCIRLIVLTITILGFCHISMAQKQAKPNLKITEIKTLPFLQNKEGVNYQLIKASIDLINETADLTANVDGNLPYSFQLKKGANVVEIPVKAVKQKEEVTLKIENKKEIIYQQSIILNPIKNLTCYILAHSHTDIGYTEIQTAVADKQVQNLVSGMEIAKKTASYPEGARFIWNVEVGWAADLYLNRMNEQQKTDFFEAVTRGEVALNGMYLNVLTGLCRPEELSRLFKFSTEMEVKTKVPITAAMTSDIPGQVWGTVTAMAQAGIKYFSTAPNYFDRIGDILVQWENKPFYWASASGKEKVLVWVPLKGYALAHTIHRLSPQFVENFYNQLDTTNYAYDIAYLRWSGHGDNAEPDPAISEFVKEWNSKYSSPKFVISSTSTAFEAFETKFGDKLETLKGDWTPYWEDGAGSSAKETGMNRASSDRLSQAEALWAMNPQNTNLVSNYPIDKFEEAWKRVLLYSEHTWGADCSVSDPENKKTKEQWEIKKSYAEDADKQSIALLNNAINSINSSIENSTIEVYNTNSWGRSGVVIIPNNLSNGGDKVTTLDNKMIESQRLTTGELAIWINSIPPFASQKFIISNGKPFNGKAMSVTQFGLDNGLVSIKLNPKSGAISEMKSLSTNNINLVNSTSGYEINDFAFLESNKIDEIKGVTDVKISILESGSLISSLRIESQAAGCNGLVREVRLSAGQDVVELTNVVDKKRAAISKKPGDWSYAQKSGKESLNFAFPFNIPNGKVRIDVPYSIYEVEKEQIPSACKNWLTANRWADVSNQETGIAVVTLDAPLFEVGDLTAVMLGSQTNPKVWMKHIEPTQTLFSWAANNHWGTNYRAYQDGEIVFRYALYPHQKFDAAQNSKIAIGLSQPLLVAASSKATTNFARIYPDNEKIIVTAFKPCDDGKGRILTILNSSENQIETNLIISENRDAKYWKSNTGEEKLEQIKKQISLSAWETMIIRVE